MPFDWPPVSQKDVAPPSSGVADPLAEASESAQPSKRQALASAHEIRIEGKDADRSEFLDVLAYALSRYPAGSMRGLRVALDEQDLDVTGGVGGFWTRTPRGPTLTIFQPDARHLHVSLHELAHNFDQWTHRGEVTRALIRAASEGGEVLERNIPSSYARAGLSSPDQHAEYGAELISWSLDLRASPGFRPYRSWKPGGTLRETLGRFLEPEKILQL